MAMLKHLLCAQRDDLIDGFPVRAVLSAFKALDPLAKLNQLLEEHQISVKLCSDTPVIVNPHLLRHGIISSMLHGSAITVSVLPEFFDASCSNASYPACKVCELRPACDSGSVVVKALMFQSACLHQLVHKFRGHSSCSMYSKPLLETVNDEQEIEALAAGLVHDLRIKHMISVTGLEELYELSPRLANMLDNSRAFAAGSLVKLQSYIQKFA